MEPSRVTQESGDRADLVGPRTVADERSIERAVEAAREFLGMDVAYATTMTDSVQVFDTLSGDGASFGIHEGMEIDVEQTCCQRVLSGRLPSLMGDVKADPRAASLPVTEAADVGAFVSVALRLSDGSVPGTLCAASHQAKPELGYRELQVLGVFARLIADQIERRALEQRERDLALQAAEAQTLVAAVSARDSYTGQHSQQVVAHAVAVSRLLDLSAEQVREVEKVALLHDIGKIGVPDAILGKPRALSAQEWAVMRGHPVLSEQLIVEIPELAHLAPALRAEHERWDGGGYPDGLAGEEIPIASRIAFVCDAYDAMTTDRPYRRALPTGEARAEIHAGAGLQFCPRAAAALLVVLAEEASG